MFKFIFSGQSLKKCYFMGVADNLQGYIYICGVRMGWSPPVNCTLPRPHQQNPRTPSHTSCTYFGMCQVKTISREKQMQS